MFYEYILECRLWKPANDKLRLFCNLDDAMQEDSKYKLQRASFYYDDYIIIIKSDDNFDMEVSFQ